MAMQKSQSVETDETSDLISSDKVVYCSRFSKQRLRE